MLKIGGEKEKILAAKREKITNLIFPKSNQNSIEKLPDEIKEGINFYFAETYEEVYQILFKEWFCEFL